MSHKNNQRGKARPDKARPPVHQAVAPRAVKAVAPPPEPPVAHDAPPTGDDASIIVATVTVVEAVAVASTPTLDAAPPAPMLSPPAAPTPPGTAPHPPNGVKPLNGHAPATPAAHPPNGATPAPHGNAPNGHHPGEGKGTKHITQRTATPPGELSEMFETLRALFVRDRTNGARPDAARCGICYLTFAREELTYHEEAGFYACPDCQAALHKHGIAMLRRQRR